MDKTCALLLDVTTCGLFTEPEDTEPSFKLVTPDNGKNVPEDFTVLVQLDEAAAAAAETGGVGVSEAGGTAAGAMGIN